MPDIFRDIATAAAKRWFTGIAFSDQLSELFSTPLQAAMQRMHQVTGVGQFRQPDAWVRRLFGVQEKKLDAAMVERVAQTLISLLPSDLQNLPSVLSSLQAPPAPPAASSSEAFNPAP